MNIQKMKKIRDHKYSLDSHIRKSLNEYNESVSYDTIQNCDYIISQPIDYRSNMSITLE
jgi:hypothetical protein